jgi:iron complex outermembrane receptor protein
MAEKIRVGSSWVVAARWLGASSMMAMAVGAAQAHSAAPAQSQDAATAPGVALSVTAAATGQATTPPSAVAADEQQTNPTDVASISNNPAQEIVVTGFRESLNSALNIKRDATSEVDAIVAQDIANFPDQNLAESLQRIPGIAISREGGEGREITVRGLGSGYTTERLNGMETIATSAGDGGPNRGRDFDYNIFASDLFRSLVIHKTSEAQLDEGSLGAVVDLNTGDPMSFKHGVTFVGSAKAQYNDLNHNWGPRLSGLLAYKDPNGLFAASISAAYSSYQTLEASNNTVRWAQARFNSVDGVSCFDANGGYVPSQGCNDVSLAFHPRIPRYGDIFHNRKRLGITGSFEIDPAEGTKISFDGLYAYYNEERRENWGEVLLRSNEKSIDVTNYKIDGNNNLVSATLNNAYVRVEDFQRKSHTKFYQFNGKVQQDFSDRFHATLFGGLSKSDAVVPSETSFLYDDRNVDGYSYDYTDMRAPKLTFPSSIITDPNAFQFAEFRDRPSDVVNKYWTTKLDTEWDVADGFKVLAGGFYRRFDFNTTGASRDSTYCAAFTCAPGTYGGPVTGLTEIFNVQGAGYAPGGTTLSYLNPDFDKAAAAIDIYNLPLNPDSANTRSVTEKDSGAFLQFNVKGTLFGLDYAGNAGVRYIHTAQSSTGINNAQTITVTRGYDDWLPSMNIALYPTSNVILRGAIAKVMARPGLGSLTPGGSVDGFNYKVSFGNPQLDPTRATTFDVSAEWYFAPQSLISVALFEKDIESSPISDTRTGTYASTGLPLSLILASSPAAANPEGQPWTINSTINGPGAKLRGAEISTQLPFRFLPGPLKNLGFIGNVTYVDSNVDYSVSGPAVDPTTKKFPQLVNETVYSPLLGTSKWQWNATLYYETKRFSLRGSLAYRSGHNDATSGTGNIFEGYNSTLQVDMSSHYDLTDHFELTFEGLNLTNQFADQFTDAATNRNYSYQDTGRVFLFGGRVKF